MESGALGLVHLHSDMEGWKLSPVPFTCHRPDELVAITRTCLVSPAKPWLLVADAGGSGSLLTMNADGTVEEVLVTSQPKAPPAARPEATAHDCEDSPLRENVLALRGWVTQPDGPTIDLFEFLACLDGWALPAVTFECLSEDGTKELKRVSSQILDYTAVIQMNDGGSGEVTLVFPDGAISIYPVRNRARVIPDVIALAEDQIRRCEAALDSQSETTDFDIGWSDR